MSDYPQYPQYPGGATPEGYAATQPPERGPRPAGVSLAVKLIWAGIAVSLAAAAITFVVLDDVIDQALQQSGAQEVPEGAIRATVIGGVVISLVIGVGLNVLLAIFIAKGANWARVTYTVLAALGIVFGLSGLASGSSAGPVVLTVLSLVGLLISVTVLVLLWKKDAAAWFATPRFPVA